MLGASGRCGSHFVRLAARRGHDVTAIVRPGFRGKPPGSVTVVRGEVTDPGFLAAVSSGHATVVSCLGLRRATLLPWSRLLSPPTLVQDVMGGLVRYAAADARVIWISAGGVGDSRERTSFPVRALIRAGHVGTAYDDLEIAERRVRDAGRPWLAVRPVTLAGGPRTGRAGPVERYGLASVVRRSDVASWMLDVADGTVACTEPAVLLGTVRRGGVSPAE